MHRAAARGGGEVGDGGGGDEGGGVAGGESGGGEGGGGAGGGRGGATCFYIFCKKDHASFRIAATGPRDDLRQQKGE